MSSEAWLCRGCARPSPTRAPCGDELSLQPLRPLISIEARDSVRGGEAPALSPLPAGQSGTGLTSPADFDHRMIFVVVVRTELDRARPDHGALIFRIVVGASPPHAVAGVAERLALIRLPHVLARARDEQPLEGGLRRPLARADQVVPGVRRVAHPDEQLPARRAEDHEVFRLAPLVGDARRLDLRPAVVLDGLVVGRYLDEAVRYFERDVVKPLDEAVRRVEDLADDD